MPCWTGSKHPLSPDGTNDKIQKKSEGEKVTKLKNAKNNNGKKAEKGGKKRKGEYFGIQKKRGGSEKSEGKSFLFVHASACRANTRTKVDVNIVKSTVN